MQELKFYNMANNIAIESLLKERQKVLDEKQRMNQIFDAQIKEFETAIERIDGKRVWEYEPAIVYDDEHPDYIKNSLEEI